MRKWLDATFDRVEPREFYRVIFPEGALERRGEYVEGGYNAIIVAVTNERKADGKRKVKRYTMTDDLDAVDTATRSKDFCLCSPLTYAGRNRTAENARMLYAIAVDVDRLKYQDGSPLGLLNMWERHMLAVGRLPVPTFIVSSGNGLHLYYVLDEPIALWPLHVRELQELKQELTRMIWHDTIVDIKTNADVQQEGIYQGFRMPGTITKDGKRAIAYRTGERVSIEYLNSFVGDKYKVGAALAAKDKKKRGMTLQQAAERFPDWYERRIVRGERKGAWATNRAVYEWWKGKIRSGATVGHRYWCIMMLAIYARKCGYMHPKNNPDPVTQEELENDAYGLIEYLDSITTSHDNHFGADDVQAALEAYNERWITYPRRAIEYRTAIQIPANKRNKQKQADHLEEARAIRDIRCRRRGVVWNEQGRPSKEAQVHQWRREHPDGRKADCIRDTKMDKKTVYKHWDTFGIQKDPAD